MPDRIEDRPRQVHGQPRAGTRPVGRVRRERSYRPYRPKRLKAGAWTSRPFYSAMTAQRKAETRARESRRPMRMSYSPLLAWVMDALRKGWTPERIEGRLKVEWPDDPRMRISHECLHRWIHAKPQRALDLRRYLPRGKRHRTRRRAGGEGTAHPDARADHGPAEEGRLAP